MKDLHTIRLTVNGAAIEREVESRVSLADFLREDLRLTGTHLGCEHGVCGACTVLVDGDAVRACLMFAVQAHGCDVRTVEGLGAPDALNPLQQAMRREHGLQCGFCTPGVLMTLTEFLEKRTAAGAPSEEEIRAALAANLCRCTGYQGIVEAVLSLYRDERGTR